MEPNFEHRFFWLSEPMKVLASLRVVISLCPKHGMVIGETVGDERRRSRLGPYFEGP